MPPRPSAFRLFTDGASRNNPGPSAIGVALYTPDDTLHTTFCSRLPGPTTSNVAEYLACLRGLLLAKSLEIPDLDVFSDSQLLINQLHGRYAIRSEHLRPIHTAILSTSAHFQHCIFTHIPRTKNSLADSLANQALDFNIINRTKSHIRDPEATFIPKSP